MSRKYINPNRPLNAAPDDDDNTCQTCGGTGRLKHPATGKPGKVCPGCGGSGQAPEPEEPEARAARALNGQPWARSWSHFLAALADKQDRRGAKAFIRNAEMSERVPSEGGFTVPEILANELLSYVAGAVIWPRATVLPMSTLRLPVPVMEDTDQDDGAQALAGLTFSMVEEGGEYPVSAPKFGRLALEARKFGGYLAEVPNELLEDASDAMGTLLGRILGEGWAWYADDLMISQGDGVGAPQALLNAPGAYTVDRLTENVVGVTDLANMMKYLHPKAERGDAVWLVADQVFSTLLELSLGVGESPSATYVPASEWLKYDEANGCWRLLGLECIPHDHLPAIGSTGDVILADLSQYLIGRREVLTVEMAAAGAGFIADTTDIRIRSRIDGRFWPQNTLTTAAGATVSPLVILSATTS